VEVGDLLAVLVAHDVAEAAVVHPLRAVFGVPDDLVDEVAEVQDEPETVRGRRLFVLEDHPAVGVLGALVHVLAAHERELHRARVVVARRRDGAADAAALAVLVGEAVPVDGRRLQAADESAAGPVRFRGERGRGRRDDVTERLVFRDLDGQAGRGRTMRGGAPRPQEHAVPAGIAGRHAFGVQVPSLAPRGRGRDLGPAAEDGDGPEGTGHLEETAP
jgi:hypothetical protein